MNSIIRILSAAVLIYIGYVFGYYHTPPEFIKDTEHTEVEMVVSVVDDPDEINRLHQIITQDPWPGVFGFAMMNGQECIITVPEPRHQEDVHAFEVIGHEVAHCIYGRWHED